MTLSARPNRNGNSESDFRNAYMELSAAKRAVDAAVKALLTDVANGRNYQHIGAAADDALIGDRRRIQRESQEVLATLGSLQSDLVEIIMESERSAHE